MTPHQTMTSLSNLVDDINRFLEQTPKLDDSLYQELAQDIVTTIKNRLSQESSNRSYLSLSSIGKPLRRVWYDIKQPLEEPVQASARLKFLYGDIIEDIALWLAKVSGHKVERRQEEVVHHGIKGHIDSIIDGEVVDVKSASPHSFTKFSQATLPHNDPFGYLAQLEGYDEEVGKGSPGFLAINKVTGEICLYQPDKMFDMPNTKVLIDNAREALDKPTPPETKCYEDVDDGKSGNKKLNTGCCYCPYKFRCWPGLRAFKYADGIKYLTVVNKEPKVEEITNGKNN